MEETKDFGELLRAFRHAAKLTIEELSEASAISVRAIGNMERGRSRGPHRRTVLALADALDLTDADRDVFATVAEKGRPRSATAGGICELPWATWDFTGRRVELAWLEDLAGQAVDEGPAVVATISGGPGSGKTALVIQAAEALTGSFPDGRFFIDLRGMDDAPLSPGTALSRLLKAFGVADGRIPRDTEERAAFYRSVLRKRRALIVLDNATNEAQIRPLLPGGGGPSLTLITSRRSLAGLEGVHRYPLTEMPPDDSVQLLRTMIGADHDTEELETIAGLCGNLPLAMRIAGNRLSSRPGWTARHLARQLADKERRLARLSAGDLHVAAAFTLSYEQLSTDARRLFRRLALVPGPDLGAAMAAVLTDTRLYDAQDELEELVELGLLQAPYVDRYRLHDLVRLFAQARLAEEEPQDTREAARERMNAWLLDVATVAGRWFEPDYGEPPADFDGLVPLSTRDEAHTWLEGEGPNWIAALRAAAEEGRHTTVIEVAGAMHWFSDRLTHWGAWREVFELSSTAAHAIDDRSAEVVHLNYLSWTLSECEGRFGESVACAQRARELARDIGDLGQQAWAVTYASAATRLSGSTEGALEYARQALRLFKAAGDWDGYPQAAMLIGDCLLELGRAEEALRQHLGLLDELNDPGYPGSPYNRQTILGLTLGRIGADHAALGNWQQAADHLRDSIPILRQRMNPSRASGKSYELGVALRELGDTLGAREAFEDALAGYEAIGDDRADDARKEIANLEQPNITQR